MVREPEEAAPWQLVCIPILVFISQDNIRLELGRGRNVSVLRSFRTVAQKVKVLVDAPNQVLLLT